MTREEFISRHPILAVLQDAAVKVTMAGNQRMALCPFHADKNPSMSVNATENLFYCHGCKARGSVIDLMAKLENKTVPQFLKENGIGENGHTYQPKREVEVKAYSYQDALGKEVYQSVRYEPKNFRQRHSDGKGGWTWKMDGIERVLYNLPAVLKSQTVWIVEGEKDADNLNALGFVATTNVGGGGKWLDAYTESLHGKDVVICGDNDKTGQEHVELVFSSLAGKVKTARLVKIPAPHKDVSDFIKAVGQAAKTELDRLCAECTPFIKGIRLPMFTLSEIEPRYRYHAQNMGKCTLDLSHWLPSLRHQVRGLVPGELVLFLGDTGVGKTAILQSIAFHANPLPTILFEMELPEELVFERFIAIGSKIKCSDIESNYRESSESIGDELLQKRFGHLLVCTEPKLSLDKLESYITRSELKFGCKAVVVLIDYVQLLQGVGKRYERTSDAAEGLKVLAKSTRTVIIVASQIHRSEYSESNEITLHSGKDSGSLENSAGLLIGAWRDEEDKSLMHLKVLKNTKGTGGLEILCNFDGSTMRITERCMVENEYSRPTTNDP